MELFCKETSIPVNAHNERVQALLSLVEDTTMHDDQISPSGDLKLISILRRAKDNLAMGKFTVKQYLLC